MSKSNWEPLRRAAWDAYQEGRLLEAEPLLTTAVDALSSSQPDNDELPKILCGLADLRHELGRVDDAVATYERAVGLLPSAAPGDNLLHRALRWLGYLEASRGNLARAADHLTRLLALQEQSLDPDDPAIGETLIRLAGVTRARGDREAADRLGDRAIRIYRPRSGSARRTADLGSCIADYLDDSGDLGGAIETLTQVIRLQVRALGPDDPDVARSRLRLARCYAGDAYGGAEAKVLARQAVDDLTARADVRPLEQARAWYELADVLQRQAAFADAADAYRRSLELRDPLLPADHPDVLRSLCALAGALFSQGAYAQADPLYRRALAAYERVSTPNDLRVGRAAHCVGETCFLAGHLDDAARFLHRALLAFSANARSAHSESVRALYTTSELMARMGRPTLARQLELLGDAVRNGTKQWTLPDGWAGT